MFSFWVCPPPPPLAQKAMMCIMRSLYPCPPSLLYYPWHDNRRTVGNNKQHVSGGCTGGPSQSITPCSLVPLSPPPPCFDPLGAHRHPPTGKYSCVANPGTYYPPRMQSNLIDRERKKLSLGWWGRKKNGKGKGRRGPNEQERRARRRLKQKENSPACIFLWHVNRRSTRDKNTPDDSIPAPRNRIIVPHALEKIGIIAAAE